MASQKGDFEAVRRDIASLLDAPDWDDGSYGPIVVRLAWHASGTYHVETGKGGSSGAGMRYEAEGGDPANAGLQHARVLLEPIKEKHPWITYSDLWTLAGVVAVKEMGGPEIQWIPGRTDFDSEEFCPPRGLLPDGAQASDHLRDIFYRMGFNDQEIVALSGAHSLGRCHADRSGWDGPWVVNPTRFSNQYYKMLTKFKWTKKEWTGPFQYRNDDLGEELMMLPTDLALIEDDAFRPWVHAYAEDKDKFFADFAKAFAKLIELGVDRTKPYESAPAKSKELGAPEHGTGLGRAKL
ncbi:heme peroxidase [Leucosporidium creatinivorum]|uniref:Peroxidase n=1 Tax=Leucosporidium creatinivorum TaxID=106004 RepID=A0A1Y2EXP8_9BASI|nr:heme peroxidase [Leucosporidium creatinivorum]